MDLNAVLVWMVCISCTVFLIRFAKVSLMRGWAIVAAIVLGITITTLAIEPGLAGLLGGSLWLIFMLAPTMCLALVNNLATRQKYRSARFLASGLRFLHPLDGLWQYPQLLKALALAQQGKANAAIAILAKYARSDQISYKAATAMTFRINAEWDRLLEWLEAEFPDPKHDSYLAVYYARALAETGNLNGLLAVLDYFERQDETAISPKDIILMRIFALAFCGETEQLAKMLSDRRLKNLSTEAKQFWLATAAMVPKEDIGSEQALKQITEAQQQLEQLAIHSEDAMLKQAIEWRLSHSLTNPAAVITPVNQKILQDTALVAEHEAKYSGAITFTSERVYATYGLIAINLAVFALEIALGGSQNSNTLYQMGALEPTAVLQGGQWWRLLNAMFLHYGSLHLIMNMVGLYFLGAFVETSLGAWRYLLTYFFSGIGSMLAVTLLTDQLTVGASGAIMGMVGATGAILWLAWRRERARFAARRLRTVLFIIGLQVFFDLSTPNISFVGHMSGLILGAIAGWALSAGAGYSHKGKRDN
jgi:rhomboid protease GluP